MTSHSPNDAQPCLSPRKREILRLLALGLSNDEIAQQICLAKSTVANQISAIYGELGLDSRAEAVCYAVCYNLVDISEMKEHISNKPSAPKQAVA